MTTGYVSAAAATGRAAATRPALLPHCPTRVLAGEGSTYRILVAAQFLTGAGTAVALQAGYVYSNTAGLDEVPSTVLG